MTHEHYNHVTYFDFPIPADFFVKDRRTKAYSHLRQRNPDLTIFVCQTCGKKFTVPKGAKLKRKNGKTYPRRFCSRQCYGTSIKGNIFWKQKEEAKP